MSDAGARDDGAAASRGAIHLSDVSLRAPSGKPTMQGIVTQVADQILADIQKHNLNNGDVGVVVAIIRDVLAEVKRGTGRQAVSSAAIEKLIKNVVFRVFPEDDPVRKNIDDILWALRTAAAFDKKTFGNTRMEFANDVPVEAVLNAMHSTQAFSNHEPAKLSPGVLRSHFRQDFATIQLESDIAREAQTLIDHGLVTEVIGLLKDDGQLSNDMKNHLKTAGIRLAVRTACNWGAIFCCSGGAAPAARGSVRHDL